MKKILMGFFSLLFLLTGCKSQEFETITVDQVVAEIENAGLEIVEPMLMTADDYGKRPQVAKEGIAFQLPSSCEECVGHIYSFSSKHNMRVMKAYYSRKGGFIFPYDLYEKENILITLPWDMLTEDAQRYEIALNNIPVNTVEGKKISDLFSTSPQTSETLITPTITVTPPLGVGSTQVSPKDGMTMVYVPAGDFLMGSPETDRDAQPDEVPQHSVYLDAFWIDQTEVTTAMFQKFIDETNYWTDAENKGYSGGLISYIAGASWRRPWGEYTDLTSIENHPVVHMTWNDANAYCEWVGRRLPSEAEWEKAARGTDGRIYPWGNEFPDTTRSNFDAADTTEVGSYPEGISPYGVLDMAGNVYEWVADWQDPDYYRQENSFNPQGPSSGERKVLRGGGWYDNAYTLRVTLRLSYLPDSSSIYRGFRCVKSDQEIIH